MKDLNNKIATFIVATSLLPVSSYAAFIPVTVDGTTYYNDNYTPSLNSQRILNDISNQEQAEAQERIRKDLMSFAKNEILNIKKSKKDINVANFEEEKEVIAPSKYSLTTKKLQFHSNKQFTKDIEPVEEKIENDNKKEENNKNEKNEVSSSDISDDEEE